MVISARKFALKVMEAVLETKPSVISTVSPVDRQAFFEEIYESVFPSVASFVNDMRGSYQDAKDIFQDALIIYFEKLSEGRLTVDVSPERYILGIAKHLWLRKFKDDRRKIKLDNFERALHIPEDFYPTVNSSRILQFLEAAGSKCLDILRGFYFEKIPLKGLATQFGYGSEHSAAVQKYKCLEKIRESINERSITYEDFFE
jgi:RNA polymerase sigma factor (sigma-70 family)